MPRIGLAIVVACLAGPGIVPHRGAADGTGGGDVRTRREAVPSIARAGRERSLEPQPAEAREVLWNFNPAAPSPFGLIPAEWDVHPQLLPTTWEAHIVFASGAPRP